MDPLGSSLLQNGYYLSYLLSELKTKDASNDDFHLICDEVVESTKQVLISLKNYSQLPNDTYPAKEEVFPKVLDKIKSILENFQKHDNSFAAFKILDEMIDKCRNLVKPKSSKDAGGGAADESDTVYKFLWDDHNNNHDSSHNVTQQHQECLSFCCDLLKCKNQNQNQNRELVMISKRKLIHWWIGFGLINGAAEGIQVLEKLVEEGFIIPITDIPRLSNISKGKGYILHARNLPKGKESPKKWGSQSPVKHQNRHADAPLIIKQSNVTPWKDPGNAVINTNTYTLNENTLKHFMDTNNVAILNLGTWSRNPTKKVVKSTKYVVVEDIDALKSFIGHSWPFLITLSFQGIRGIVKLPEAVYNISSLKVLDLKACPNLEILPPGINSLKLLTHLDLSECYLLDHIPKGLASLTNLQVLKGFIINYYINPNKECAFHDLANLTGLIKLAVRARTTNFPTISNVKTMNKMTQLKYLKVVWVQSINSYDMKINPKNIGTNVENNSDTVVLKLPETLEKLELQAASEINASQMLDLISFKSGYCPKKLYIRGGDLWKLDPYTYYFTKVETLRLRYLPKLHMKWSDCQSMFPKLSHLEVLECPKLVCFPCDDNGTWNKSDES